MRDRSQSEHKVTNASAYCEHMQVIPFTHEITVRPNGITDREK